MTTRAQKQRAKIVEAKRDADRLQQERYAEALLQQREEQRIKYEEEQRADTWNIVSTTTGEIRCTVSCSNIQVLSQLRGANALGSGIGDEVLRHDPDSKYGDGDYWYPLVADGEPSLMPIERIYPDHLDPIKRQEKRIARREARRKQEKARKKQTEAIVKVLQHLQDQGIDLGPDAQDLFK